ncbi:MAG: hypothetical protein A2X86_08135 [Bdellovibrionales bacterium GWA2_49_15]|nr:MAG: hypothetical protein A2X86_08135 [Bdellovibrionales bacterium GWA2_49_15]HAZ13922.1 hypothetical protein [Bdellovibrionales bacterium]
MIKTRYAISEERSTRASARVICYFFAYYFIFAAAINDGNSSFYLGIPYGLFLLWEVNKEIYQRKLKPLIINLCFLIFIGWLFFGFDKFSSSLVYPIIGKEIITQKEFKFAHKKMGQQDDGDVVIEGQLGKSELGTQEVTTVPVGTKFKIQSLKVTGYPDFSTHYKFRIRFENDPGHTSNLGSIYLNSYDYKQFEDDGIIDHNYNLIFEGLQGLTLVFVWIFYFPLLGIFIYCLHLSKPRTDDLFKVIPN